MEVRRRLVEEAEPLPDATSSPPADDVGTEILSTEDGWEDTPAPTTEEPSLPGTASLAEVQTALEQLIKRVHGLEVAKTA